MWLLKKLSPDFKTIADFRKDNRGAIKRVCREFVLLCKKRDLFWGELVGIDGSKFKAVNSKKKNFNEAKLKKRLKEIEEKIEKVAGEISLSILAYNIKRVINIVGLKGLILAL